MELTTASETTGGSGGLKRTRVGGPASPSAQAGDDELLAAAADTDDEAERGALA